MSLAVFHSLSSSYLTFMFRFLTTSLNDLQWKREANINVTVRRIRAVEKQYILHILILCVCVCVCSLIYRTYKEHEPYYISVCGLSVCNIFFTSQTLQDFLKKIFRIYSMCFDSLCKYCLNHLLS